VRRRRHGADRRGALDTRQGQGFNEEAPGVGARPAARCEQSVQRDLRMAELLSRAEHCVAKLDAQDEGKKSKGRKLSDAGARARLYHEVIEARLGRIIKVDLKNEQLSWTSTRTLWRRPA